MSGFFNDIVMQVDWGAGNHRYYERDLELSAVFQALRLSCYEHVCEAGYVNVLLQCGIVVIIAIIFYSSII